MQSILVYMALSGWRSCNEVGLVNQMFHSSRGFLIGISLDIRMLLCRAKNGAVKKENKDRKGIIHSTTTTTIIIVSKWEKLFLKMVNWSFCLATRTSCCVITYSSFNSDLHYVATSACPLFLYFTRTNGCFYYFTCI